MEKYRKTHRRCRYCQWCKIEHTPIDIPIFYRCELKDKLLASDLPSWRGFLCRWYEPRMNEIK